MSDLTTFEKMNEFEEQKQTIIDLKSRVEEAELKFVEGEKLRKKLHNTILVWSPLTLTSATSFFPSPDHSFVSFSYCRN